MALPTALLVKGGIGATTVVLGGVAIAKREDIYYSIYPNDNRELNEKIRDLGISGCELENKETKTKECELDEAKVKAIKFDGKTGDTVTGLSGDKKINLVIEKGYTDFKKSETPNDLYFPEGLRFIFKNPETSGEVTIGATGNQITLKPGVSYDFKIKDNTKLEKAWNLTTIGDKVGLTCTNGGSPTECTLKTSGINVWKSEEDYITGATQTDSNKKMCVAKDTKDHNGGFKFTVEGNSDITLTNGTKKKATDGISKLTQSNKSYEIDIKDLGDNKGKKWFLVEKDTTPAA